MTAFEFLYYCMYRVFRLVKREGEKDENLASLFYSILLSTNTLMIVASLLRYVVPTGLFSDFPFDILLKIFLTSIFIIWYFLCKSYFLRKGNYVRIVAKYDRRYPTGSKRISIIGIAYAMATFISFIVSALLQNNIA